MTHSVRGFTLLELSIVIVVIGLLVAAVTAGRELVHSSEILKIIAQRDAFDAAVSSFDAKFDCLPGDCPNAYNYGAGTAAGYGTNGNGNHRLEAPSASVPTYENGNLWYHLSKAKFISWAPPAAGPALGVTAIAAYAPNLAVRDPSATGLTSAWWPLYARDSQAVISATLAATLRNIHYWWIAASIGDGGTGSAVLIPADAYAIDKKIDDGLPLSGNVLAAGDANGSRFGPQDPSSGAGGASASVCVSTSTTPSSYNVANRTRSAATMCSMLIGTSF